MTYAGDVDPRDAYNAIMSNPNAALVDVRTQAELAYVGAPDLSSLERSLITVEWVTYPHGRPNPGFLADLEAHGLEPGQPIYFLCRSGVRSRFAAEHATAAGDTEADNVAHGFEGPRDDQGHRGAATGWKADGLPWRQT